MKLNFILNSNCRPLFGALECTESLLRPQARVCDFTDTEHPVVAQTKNAIDALMTAVGFVCREHDEGKYHSYSRSNYFYAYVDLCCRLLLLDITVD